eukprot:249956-Pelagomonas_calceolata.AAC.2
MSAINKQSQIGTRQRAAARRNSMVQPARAQPAEQSSGKQARSDSYSPARCSLLEQYGAACRSPVS